MSAWMRTAGRCPPERLTRPTPGSCEIFCARRVSTKSSTSVSFIVFDVRPSARIGAWAGLSLAMMGGVGRACGQQIARGIDSGLLFLFGDVERDGQAELQGDDRRARRTDRAHLVEV